MSQENVEVVRRFYDAMSRGDLNTLGFFDPHVVVLNSPNSPDTAPYFGHEGLAKWTQDVRAAVGDFRFEADETIDVDDARVVVVGRVCGEGRASGLPVEVSLATVFTLQEGKIIRAQAYDSKAEALEAVGLRE